MSIAHRIRIYPTEAQENFLARACGVARFAYNWALSKKREEYQEWVKAGKPEDKRWMSEMDLRKMLNSIKEKEFEWMLESPKGAPQQAIRNLGKAFRNFLEGRAKYPKFKKKFKRDSFYIDNFQLKMDEKYFYCPGGRKRRGAVKLKLSEPLRITGKILSATISRVAGKWFVSVTVEPDVEYLRKTYARRDNQGRVGVDLGITDLATLSNGEVHTNPKALNLNLQRVKRLGRKLSRQAEAAKAEALASNSKTISYSKNYRKTKLKLAKVHHRISNIRKDGHHKLTNYLAKTFNEIVIEDLNVKGMMQNGKLARHIADRAFFEFKRQVMYKAKLFGSKVIVADRWFASSKTCSSCGTKKETLSLSERSWVCACGAEHDRDLNAALNLRNYRPEPRGRKTKDRLAVSAEFSALPLVSPLVTEGARLVIQKDAETVGVMGLS